MDHRLRPLAIPQELRDRGDRAGLVRALRVAHRHAPGDRAIALELGVALRLAGRPAEALPHLASAYGTSPAVLVELGRTRMAMLDLDAARAFFAAALSDPRSAAAARLGLAAVARLSGTPRTALALAGGAQEDAALDIERLLVQAAAWLDLGETGPALALLADGIDLGLERARVLVLRARASRLGGEIEDARLAIRLALGEPGAAFPALIELGLVELANGGDPDPEMLVVDHGVSLYRPQEFLADTSVAAGQAAAATRFVSDVVELLGEHGVPIAASAAPGQRRIVLHLAGDLPLDLATTPTRERETVH